MAVERQTRPTVQFFRPGRRGEADNSLTPFFAYLIGALHFGLYRLGQLKHNWRFGPLGGMIGD
jgi:hypothetical protein